MSVDRANRYKWKRSTIEQILFKNGGPTVRQSFKLTELLSPLQLQLYMILMAVALVM